MDGIWTRQHHIKCQNVWKKINIILTLTIYNLWRCVYSLCCLVKFIKSKIKQTYTKRKEESNANEKSNAEELKLKSSSWSDNIYRDDLLRYISFFFFCTISSSFSLSHSFLWLETLYIFFSLLMMMIIIIVCLTWKLSMKKNC